jgi:cytidyltransferase-like protein
MEKIILVSGGFDPIHIGHLQMFQEAKKLGDRLIVIANNDNFLLTKKGYVFMPEIERIEIIKGFDCVDDVFLSVDEDLTVSKSIEEISQKYNISIFANGGDRKDINDIPEYEVCKNNNIELIFEIGGGKIQSSSDLAKRSVKKPWGHYATYEKDNGYLLKSIRVNSGEKLSLQSHNHRSEFWVVARGKALVEIDGIETLLLKGQSIVIPLKATHRLSNPGSHPLDLVELQFGDILEESDIIRYEDIYGRES